MLTTILMCMALAASPPAAPQMQFERSEVRVCQQVGDFTYLVLDTQDTWLLPTSLLSLSPEDDLVIDGDASVLTSSYVDAQGVNHTVTTDCRRYSSAQACADAHAAMVAKMRILFPPPPRGP